MSDEEYALAESNAVERADMTNFFGSLYKQRLEKLDVLLSHDLETYCRFYIKTRIRTAEEITAIRISKGDEGGIKDGVEWRTEYKYWAVDIEKESLTPTRLSKFMGSEILKTGRDLKKAKCY